MTWTSSGADWIIDMRGGAGSWSSAQAGCNRRESFTGQYLAEGPREGAARDTRWVIVGTLRMSLALPPRLRFCTASPLLALWVLVIALMVVAGSHA